jgi:hypothetical protein
MVETMNSHFAGASARSDLVEVEYIRLRFLFPEQTTIKMNTTSLNETYKMKNVKEDRPGRSDGCASCLQLRRAVPHRPAEPDTEVNLEPDLCAPNNCVQTFVPPQLLPLLLLLQLSLPVQTQQ